jgi:hypothetical protein
MATFEHGHALVVGVGADLPNTVDDATGLADILKDSGRCAYAPGQVRLLTGEGAARAAILEALDQLAVVTDDRSTVVIYFSGHGYRATASTGPTHYLMPYGYDVDRLYQTAIGGQPFADKLQAIPAQKLLVLLDCCHAGGVGEAKGVELAKAPLPPEAVRLLAQGSGRVLIASSTEEERSFAGRPYSAFTLALIEALSGVGVAKKDGYVRVSDLALHAREVVPGRTAGRQHPILHWESGDNFVVATYAGGDAQPKGLPFTVEPEIEPEPGAWTVHGSQTQIAGDVHGPVLSGQFEGPVTVGGNEAVDLRGSQGAVVKPSGPVEQQFGHRLVIRDSQVSGQVAVGQGNVQMQTVGAPESEPKEADQAVLRQILAELEATVAAQVPVGKRDAALGRLQEFSEALTAREPDLATIEYVQGWFARQLPDLAEAVARVVAHPTVVQWVDAAGDAVAQEYRRRFGV